MPPNNLVRQSYGFCFRMKVPPDLRPMFGKAELRYSLYTESLQHAKKRSHEISRRLKALFKQLRESKTMRTKDEIGAIIRELIDSGRKRIDEDYSTSKQSSVPL